MGMAKSEVDALLAPARQLIDDAPFWQHQADGLAVLLEVGKLRTYRQPKSFEELVVVGDAFHLAPLLPLATEGEEFYILALSQNQVRLLLADRHQAREVPLSGVPTSLADALGHDYKASALQMHSGVGGPAGGQAAAFHGQAAADDSAKEEVGRYFQRVDSALWEKLREQPRPMVLAAVEYQQAIYRQVSHYPQLVDEGVAGNPDDATPAELHGKAWPLVAARFDEERRKAVERCRELLGTGRASNHLEEIVPAAHDGRVEHLFLVDGEHRWGRFDVAQREVDLYDGPSEAARDLLDLAAGQSFLHAGKVSLVSAEELPGEAPAAALFRY